jgi:hypothetical protein
MKKLFIAYFHQKKFQKKIGRKFIRVRIRIRNRIRIRTFSKVGSGSGQKSSGSATLPVALLIVPVASKLNSEITNKGTFCRLKQLKK